MPTRNVNLTEELDRERQYEAKIALLHAAIDAGDASGIAQGDVFHRVRETLDLRATPR